MAAGDSFEGLGSDLIIYILPANPLPALPTLPIAHTHDRLLRNGTPLNSLNNY